MGGKSSTLKKKSEDVIKQKERRNSGLRLIEAKVAHEIETEMDGAKFILKMGEGPKAFKEVISCNGDGSPDGTNLSEDSKSIIKRAILKLGIFTDEVNKRNISIADIQNIINAFRIINYEDGEYLYNQNDFPSDNLFIARGGMFRGLVNEECKSEMRSSEIIGEMEFFYQMHRKVSVVACRANGQNPSVYRLSKRDFKLIVEKGRDLKSMKMLQVVSDAQKYLIKDRVTIINYYRGAVNYRCSFTFSTHFHPLFF